jgi:deazaflavin-dependent oxidoreductase (nitroreductase family)
VFGLRRQPGRLALAFMRMPLLAYRHDAGWLLGRTFIEFTHVGRKTGRPYEAVAMVLRRDETTGESVVCAAWGPGTDWYRNLRHAPPTLARIGRESFAAERRFLGEDEAYEVVEQFRREHPHRVRLLSRVLGLGTLAGDAQIREFVRTRPFVALRPAAPAR